MPLIFHFVVRLNSTTKSNDYITTNTSGMTTKNSNANRTTTTSQFKEVIEHTVGKSAEMSKASFDNMKSIWAATAERRCDMLRSRCEQIHAPRRDFIFCINSGLNAQNWCEIHEMWPRRCLLRDGCCSNILKNWLLPKTVAGVQKTFEVIRWHHHTVVQHHSPPSKPQAALIFVNFSVWSVIISSCGAT